VFSPLNLTSSGEAAFALKNLLAFQKVVSDAGIVAGVFFDYGCSRASLKSEQRA
jgi:hypothetical protein